MYMYFVVGIWLLGLMATVVSIVFERQKRGKMVYALGIPGIISIGSLWAYLIVISLQFIGRGYSSNAWTAITFSMLGAVVLPLVFYLLTYDKLRSKFLWAINLVYFITIIVGVCFVYPTVMYFVK